jgi:hypothetical protein
METAVEFLESQYNYNDKLTAVDFEQAKKMFEKQIIDACKKGFGSTAVFRDKLAEQYYKETFKK